MNKDLTDWLKQDFWPLYLSLCKTPYRTKWGAGDPGKAMKAVNTLKPSKELREEILEWTREVIRHRRRLFEMLKTKEAYEAHTYKLRDNGIYCNKRGQTFINGFGWFCEIPSITEMTTNKVIPIREIYCTCVPATAK